MNDLYGKSNFRPISAVSKLGKIKKNIIPSLLKETNTHVQTFTGIKREYSSDHRNSTRIKSAHPMNVDREKLMQENIILKTQLNKMQVEKINHKREIVNLENEINQKDKIIEEMMNESQTNSNTFTKASEMNLVINVKKQYKELKKEYEKSVQELQETKKSIKFTKINELITENKVYSTEIEKLRNLYKNSETQKNNMIKNIQDNNLMKQALNKQDFIIIEFQENCKKMTNEIEELNVELEKMQKQKQEKNEIIQKIKKKLKLQKQINEKLVMTKENIKNTDEYLQMRNKYEAKLQKLRKDLAYYKDSNAKNEKLLRDAKSFNKTLTNNNNLSNRNQRLIYSSNPKPIPDIESAPEGETNNKILLLQSIYQEEKLEREKLEKQVIELNNKLQNLKEPKIILSNSYSASNIRKSTITNEYDYFNKENFDNFSYVLLKNLEASKIDMFILEQRVLNSENLDLLKDINQHTNFITKISTSLCEILKIQQEKDIFDVHSFIRTLVSNIYLKKNFSLTNLDSEFKEKFLSFFTNVSFYSSEQKIELDKILAIKLIKSKEKLIQLLKYFDPLDKGYINFNIIDKILEILNIKLKKETKEYFIYIMKFYGDEGTYLRDLKYQNLLKILDDFNVDNLEDIENIDDIDKEKDDNEDDAIEITNEEYLNKVKDIIIRMCKVLINKNRTLDSYLLNTISKSIVDFRCIRLAKLVDVLKKDFNIELSNIEIFCLFTKVKGGNENAKDTDDDIEEIIDYDKLLKEVDFYMKDKDKVLSYTSPSPSDNVAEKKNSLPKNICGNNPNTNRNNNDEHEHETKESSSNKIVNQDKDEDRKKKPSSSSSSTPGHKLGYPDMLEHADAKYDVNNEKENVKRIFCDFLKKHKFSFERFIFPIHCMMKLSTNGKIFNRYIDIEFFKHFLYQNGILISSEELRIFFLQDKLLLNNDRVNVEYLKFILTNNNKEKLNKKDFIMFKPILERPEAAKIRKENNDKDLDEDLFDESESMRMIQKEMNGED